MKGKVNIDPKTKVPLYLYEFLDVFNRPSSEGLVLYRLGIDYSIKLTENDTNKLPYRKPYSMTRNELDALFKYI